ncbi:MAG: response regulator [Candidatus Zixiibacteriota bacterium]|nr:MAG: response regulator [candidate division Zixibacteria bacterium]HHI03092.1 response regulator [candidate division Zixibacteria bacterium]
MDVKRIEKMVTERGKAFKILIVDDEPRIREIFRDFCELTNSVEVDLAENGADAVSKVENSNYDLVTMDLIMPEMAGVEAVSRIKNIRPHLPVIVITGNATERLVNQVGVKGASSILYKPVLLDNFIDEVVSTLERSSSR